MLAELLHLPDLARHVRHRARREGVPASLLEAGLDDGCADTVFGARAVTGAVPVDVRAGADGRGGTDPGDGDDVEALPAALVVDLARGACPPARIAHAEAVERHALELLAAVGKSLGLVDGTVADDVRIAAYAHDLFRDVDGSWLLAMCSDVDHPIDALAWDHPVLLHGAVAAIVLARDLGLDRSLGDRWSRVRLAVSSHTVGIDTTRTSDLRGDAAFAAVVHLADARAKAEEDAGRSGTTEDWWARALAGDLAGAYDTVLARRAERVLAEGRVVAAVTRRAAATVAASPPIDLRDAVEA